MNPMEYLFEPWSFKPGGITMETCSAGKFPLNFRLFEPVHSFHQKATLGFAMETLPESFVAI